MTEELNELYHILIELSKEEKQEFLIKYNYDYEVLKTNQAYIEFSEKKEEILKKVRYLQDQEILENSFLFAKDYEKS